VNLDRWGTYVFKVKSVYEIGHVLSAPLVELGGDDVLVSSGSEVLLYKPIALV
jgi:hypothetical protein